VSNEVQSGKIEISDQKKLEAAYALNLCTVSLNQIIDYSDPYILEQEYDAILNNLNIQNIIHDESMLTLIKKILETLTFYRIQEGDKKFLDQEYQGRMKSAIWSAVPSLSVILAGGNPITAAVAVASQIGIGYMNYRKTKRQTDLEKEKKEWELKRALIEEISGLQRELFETAWRLSDKYNFDDRYRLTEKQIKRYSAILMDPDPLRRYERLDTQKEIFHAFPPFWYYKGNAAKEIAHKYATHAEIVSSYTAKALEDYRKFNSIYVELMREDVIAASCAIEHIALLDQARDAEEVKNLLNRVMRFAGENFDVLQIAVLNYISLGENAKAKAILRRLVNEGYNIGLNGLLLSRIYCKWDKSKAEYQILQDRIGPSNVIPWIEDDKEADQQYIAISENKLSRRFEHFLTSLVVHYQNKFNETVGYDPSLRLRKQVDWCLATDITLALVDISNELFVELFESEIFAILNRANGQSWKDFFKEQALSLSEKIKKINAIQVKVKTAILEIMKNNPFGLLENFKAVGDLTDKAKENAGKAFDSINKKFDGKLDILKSGVTTIGSLANKAVENTAKTFDNALPGGNEAEQEKLKSANKVLLQSSNIGKYTSDFFAALKNEFRKNLTVESVVGLQERMKSIFDKWYSANGFPVFEEKVEETGRELVLTKQSDIFFTYPNEDMLLE
jgi:hypothetical protein